MSGVVDRIFGGTDTSAQDYTIAQNANSRNFIQQQGNQAQQLLGNALPQIQGQIGQGYQSAANLLGGLIPQQVGALNQGNLDAQRFLLGSLPLYQQALMGIPLNLPQLTQQVQRSQIAFDPSFLSQPLPNPFQRV